MTELTEREIFKQICENDFAFFARQYLKVVEPETEFEWNWHLDTLCHYCERVYYGDIQNLDINIPPRMLKSIIISVLFPCWIWTKKPSFKILAASSSAALANNFNIKRRDLIESREFQYNWRIQMKEDINTMSKFENSQNGFMQAISAGGKVTGVGADLLLSDDLIDAREAFSRLERESVCQWYSSAFYNRAQNKKTVKRININQRLHSNDVSGHIASNYKSFKTLVIPMQKMKDNPSTVDFVDPRKSEGDFIQPSRYGQTEKDDEYTSLGVYGWSSQMQQRPVPEGGGIIKDEWIRTYVEPPKNFTRHIITADLTFKGSKTSDYVCFQYWGEINKDKYLLDIVRGKWSYKETKDHFKSFCEKNNAGTKWVEDKANGPALISDLSSEMTGIRAWPPKGSPYTNIDKVQRLHMCSQEFEIGRVYVPENLALAKVFVNELTSFSENGSTTGNDDMVDTATMALIELKKAQTFFSG